MTNGILSNIFSNLIRQLMIGYRRNKSFLRDFITYAIHDYNSHLFFNCILNFCNIILLNFLHFDTH
jgi:hypothetical protein